MVNSVLTSDKQMQVRHVREMMRPLHVTRVTGRDLDAERPSGEAIHSFLSLKFRRQTAPASGGEAVPASNTSFAILKESGRLNSPPLTRTMGCNPPQ